MSVGEIDGFEIEKLWEGVFSEFFGFLFEGEFIQYASHSNELNRINVRMSPKIGFWNFKISFYVKKGWAFTEHNSKLYESR